MKGMLVHMFMIQKRSAESDPNERILEQYHLLLQQKCWGEVARRHNSFKFAQANGVYVVVIYREFSSMDSEKKLPDEYGILTFCDVHDPVGNFAH